MNTPTYIQPTGRATRLSLFRLPLLLVAFTLNLSLRAATYYVATNGDDANPGTEAQPWLTLQKANSMVAPGDTVVLRGGTWAGNEIRPGVSGTAVQPIAYQAYTGEKPVLTQIQTAIDLSDRAYIIVDGITADGELMRLEGSRIEKWARLSGSQGGHNVIQNCTFLKAEGWAGLEIVGGSEYNKILNNTFDFCGWWYVPNTKNGDMGDGLSLESAHNLIEGNLFRHVGHTPLFIDGFQNVIRNNVFDCDWSDMTPVDKDGVVHTDAGSRAMELVDQPERTGPSGYNLLEGNVIKNHRRSQDDVTTQGMKASGEGQILRRNYFFGGSGEAIATVVYDKVPLAVNLRIYHNVFYNNGAAAWSCIRNGASDALDGNVIKNNVFYKNRRYPLLSAKPNDDVDILIHHPVLYYPETGSLGTNQVVHNSLVCDEPGDARIRVTDFGVKTIGWFEANHPANFWGNVEEVPQFVATNPGTPDEFKLQSSSALIDAGDFLTRAVGEGTNSTALIVQDAGYFCDGFGVVAGDIIQIAGAAPVQILAVDYDAEAITLAEPRSWADNAGVSLPYEGAAPDIGAQEFAMGPAAPTGLTATAVSANQIDLQWTDNASDETAFRIQRRSGAGTYTDTVPATVGANTVTFGDTAGVFSRTTYYYQVRAENPSGYSAWSAEAAATTPEAPLNVTITTPVGGTALSGQGIPIAATTSGIAVVAGVTFKLDGVALTTEDKTAPYGFRWTSLRTSDGSHVLTAVARDTAGNTATSAPVMIVVDNLPPTVALTAPTAGAVVGGVTIQLTATATDIVGVAGVQFKADGQNIGTEDATAPYAVAWDASGLGEGNHFLTAVARDLTGRTTVSAPVTVLVDNTAPTVAITDPAAGSTIEGTVTVSATANDAAPIAGVQFKLNGADLGAEDSIAPFSVDWTPTSADNGSHVLTAVARDAAGNTATSAPVTVAVAVAASAPLLFEAESLTYVKPSDDDTTLTSVAGATNGTCLVFNGDGTGDYITYTVNVPTAGVYTITTVVATGGNRGIYQLSVDGENQGAAYDDYSTSVKIVERVLGTKFLAAGAHSFRFLCTGKNSAAGNRRHALDYIKLTP